MQATLFRLQEENDWQGVMALEGEVAALAARLDARSGLEGGTIHCILGHALFSTGQFERALEEYKKHFAAEESGRGLKGVASACGNIGNCYHILFQYKEAMQMHERKRDISEKQGDKVGVAMAYGSMGISLHAMGKYTAACALHEKERAIYEALGDDEGLAVVSGNLGNCYNSLGENVRAVELHKECQVICTRRGDRGGLAKALGNLAVCYDDMGEYERGREMHKECLLMCRQIGDSFGIAIALGNVGYDELKIGDYSEAIRNFTQQYEIGLDLKLEACKEDGAMGAGVALALQVRAERVRADALASACARETASRGLEWLQTALEYGRREALLHLARIAVDVGDDDTAVAHLQGYLSWRVQQAPTMCAGCDQTRGEDAQMLMCGGCRVARFCSVKHQKMASKSAVMGGSFLQGRHRDVCALLGQWRQHVVKGGMSPDVLRADLLAFLRT